MRVHEVTVDWTSNFRSSQFSASRLFAEYYYCFMLIVLYINEDVNKFSRLNSFTFFFISRLFIADYAIWLSLSFASRTVTFRPIIVRSYISYGHWLTIV